MSEFQVKTYTVHVHDRRHAAPILLAAELAHDKRAWEFACERLASSPHYVAIDVWDGTTRLYHLEAQDCNAQPRAA